MNLRSLPLAALAAAIPFAGPGPASAAPRPIEVSAEAAAKRTVSFAALRGDGSEAARLYRETLRDDLLLSGWFQPVDGPSASVELGGGVSLAGAGILARVTASWASGARSDGWEQRVASDSGTVRDAAHAMADTLVSEIAGHPPMASSKILFVGRDPAGGTEIYRCDADGKRLLRVTTDGALCLSPNWNPGENSFLFTTWRTGSPTVWELDLSALRRKIVSGRPGMNQGAVKSPDGKRIAIVLSRSGSVDLYLADAATHRVVDRLTKSRDASESSPTWSPDGSRIAYVSDAGGRPRVHVMDLASRYSTKLVYSSAITESVAPEWGPTGVIAFCGRSGGRYRIYAIDPSKDAVTAVLQPLSPEDGADYEDPSWAPDGRHVVCTRTSGYRRSLVVLDTMGDPARTLVQASSKGDWYLPSWSDNGVGAGR